MGEEEARASGLLVDADDGDSPGSSPRNRRNSGSVNSRDAGSPRMSPRNSPRESLNSSPGQMISPRNSPPTLRPLISPFFKGLDSESDILDFSLHRSAQGYREELFNMASKSSPLRGSPPPLGLHRTGDSPLDFISSKEKGCRCSS
ncbi:hypothetical protein Anas_08177 [Armadillidium nasatum]|uniref:Uncharacterized protein n=1 Tax=Armadillidium nasatum TaxID=96803 RepID=A0A5N5TBC7_9CRUS|nr:hypothetical protein Anas_08177 [Armadillidium nasatum]